MWPTSGRHARSAAARGAGAVVMKTGIERRAAAPTPPRDLQVENRRATHAESAPLFGPQSARP